MTSTVNVLDFGQKNVDPLVTSVTLKNAFLQIFKFYISCKHVVRHLDVYNLIGIRFTMVTVTNERRDNRSRPLNEEISGTLSVYLLVESDVFLWRIYSPGPPKKAPTVAASVGWHLLPVQRKQGCYILCRIYHLGR